MSSPGVSGRIAAAFLESKLTPILVISALALGVFAVLATPREEEPQIVVPMIDVGIGWPGAAPSDVERLVAVPLERSIRRIPEVEYVYVTSRPSGALLIVRFYVNSDPERALVNVRARVAEALPGLPPGATAPEITERSIDDVPIFAATFSSDTYDPMTLRRIASEVEEDIRRVPHVAQTTLMGGLRREIRVELNLDALAAREIPPTMVAQALASAGISFPSGTIGSRGVETIVEGGEPLRSAAEIGAVVVTAKNGATVRVRDVARVIDGPEEARSYVFHARAGHPTEPAVTLAIAKTRGANATTVASDIAARLEVLRGRLIPKDVTVTVTRNYGATAEDKSNELIFHLLLATASVTLLIALTLGWRGAVVVGVAVPVTLALTLLVYWLMGYTLNRVTLFALIFSIGILVDDAIVVIENIHRRVIGHDSPRHAAISAVDEVGNPTILATFTVIAAILPMAFVSGLMGPYMRPIPVGASFAMLISLVVAFVVTPWLALKLLAHHGEHAGPEDQAEAWVERTYRRVMRPLIERPAWRWGALGVVFVLLLGAVALVPLELVTVKMLPFDNKSELEVVVDAPEGVPLETTLAAAREIADRLVVERGVRDAQVYAGTASPITFNGLVRHYFLRTGGNVADVQVNLLPKNERDVSSHAFALAVRPLATAIAKSHGLRVKIVEVPPGPPVLSTLVAEVYGDDPAVRRENAHEVLAVFEKTEGVVDSDWYVEDPQPKARFVLDRAKAALTGVNAMQVAATLRLAVDGARPAVLEGASDREPVPIDVTLPRADRSRLDRLAGIRLGGSDGAAVPLGEIAHREQSTEEPSLYRKNGRPVTYVVGEVAGREESPVYAILRMADAIGAIGVPGTVVWDGEWRITVDVFRDLGVAFGAVLILIYVLVVAWFRSFLTPLLIMAPIPLTLVGILPGHAVTGMFFTATSMIGMIALAGIIVRNSILLVDFVEAERERGATLEAAVLSAGAVRFRPIALTAAAVIAGGLVMVLDPIFQGLAIALMSGVFASTVLTLVVIPLLYYVAHRGRSVVATVSTEDGSTD
jgi:multidrug efflux pump subunit AcrB